MSKKTLRIILVIVSILYFTIGTPQSSSAAPHGSTMATAEAQYHPFFPKTAGNGLQGVMHVQNAGTADAFFQVDFYAEQGAVVKRYYGTVKPGAAHTLAAQAWAALPVGVYGVRVTSSNAQPLITVVRVKDTSRAVTGLGFDPGVSQSRLATTFHGGPIYGGTKASTIHLFNPTPATVNGEITLTTLTGTPVAPRAWSLPAYGRTTITFNTQPADFVGTVQITASTAIAALLQQSSVNDGLELQAFNPPATRHFLPRVHKAVAESDGVYTTELLISNPTANAVSVDVSLTASEGQLPTTTVALNPNSATFFDLRDLSGVADGVYEAIIYSTAPVVLSEITDTINTTANAKATYAGQGFTTVTQWQTVETRLFFPRAVRADHSYSSLNLQNSSDSDAYITIAAYNADGTKNGADLLHMIPAKEAKKYYLLSNVSTGFIGSIVVSSDRLLVGWMDEDVLTGDEPDPVPAPIDPPAPVASFSAAKRAGIVPLEVQFINTSEGEYTSSRWDFGDGQSSTVMAPTHTYTQPGVYTVTLTVDGPAGNHTTVKGAYITVRSTPATHPDGWDRDFGDGGFVDSGCTVSHFTGTSATQVTPDNKLLMYVGCDQEHKLLRFLADGTLDPSFGVQGQAPTINGLYINSLPAIQRDGKIIMLDSRGRIVRHLANGAYDSTFAPSATTPSQIGIPDDLLIQADNQLVIGGAYGVSRFTQDGMSDTTLAGTGYVLTDQILPKPNSEAEQSLLNVAVQPDGKLLLLIETRRKGNIFDQTQQHKLVILRLNSNGSLDQSFASAGRFVVFEKADINYFYGANYNIWVQPNGQLLVAHPIDNRLLRLQPNGALDATFQSPETAFFQQRLVDQHGAIIIQNADEMQRLSADGLPDGNFGQNGRLRVAGTLRGMTMLQDGSLIVIIRDDHSFKLLRNVKTMNPPVTPVAVFLPTIWR